MFKKILFSIILTAFSLTQPFVSSLVPKCVKDFNVSSYLPSATISAETLKSATYSASNAIIKQVTDTALAHPIITGAVALGSTSYISYKLGAHIQHKKDLPVEAVIVKETVQQDQNNKTISKTKTTKTIKKSSLQYNRKK